MERGSHKELIKQDGVYAELYKTQFARADAEEEERRAERLKRREERRTKRGFMENGYTEGETPVPIDS